MSNSAGECREQVYSCCDRWSGWRVGECLMKAREERTEEKSAGEREEGGEVEKRKESTASSPAAGLDWQRWMRRVNREGSDRKAVSVSWESREEREERKAGICPSRRGGQTWRRWEMRDSSSLGSSTEGSGVEDGEASGVGSDDGSDGSTVSPDMVRRAHTERTMDAGAVKGGGPLTRDTRAAHGHAVGWMCRGRSTAMDSGRGWE